MSPKDRVVGPLPFMAILFVFFFHGGDPSHWNKEWEPILQVWKHLATTHDLLLWKIWCSDSLRSSASPGKWMSSLKNHFWRWNNSELSWQPPTHNLHFQFVCGLFKTPIFSSTPHHPSSSTCREIFLKNPASSGCQCMPCLSEFKWRLRRARGLLQWWEEMGYQRLPLVYCCHEKCLGPRKTMELHWVWQRYLNVN